MDLDFAAITLLSAFLGGVVCAFAGATILSEVDRTMTGLLLGFFLGPLGLIIAWAMRSNRLHQEEARRRQHHPPTDGYLATARAARRDAAVSPIDELERLAALRERGHLSDEEFNRRKAQLLEQNEPPRRAFR